MVELHKRPLKCPVINSSLLVHCNEKHKISKSSWHLKGDLLTGTFPFFMVSIDVIHEGLRMVITLKKKIMSCCVSQHAARES